jgi:hypothetical protein
VYCGQGDCFDGAGDGIKILVYLVETLVVSQNRCIWIDLVSGIVGRKLQGFMARSRRGLLGKRLDYQVHRRGGNIHRQNQGARVGAMLSNKGLVLFACDPLIGAFKTPHVGEGDCGLQTLKAKILRPADSLGQLKD